MNQLNQNGSQNQSGFPQSREDQIRFDRIKNRLLKLMEISEDPYYDQYLQQMLKDLSSGKATPFQVEKEAERTYALYRERMKGGQMKGVRTPMEFKIGAGIFSIVGALFVLVSLVLFGFKLSHGIWQGLCFYGAGLLVLLLSELLLKRFSEEASGVMTGIAIAGLYISNMINYLVLKNIGGLTACAITVLVAAGAILISRKKNTAFLRVMILLGSYLCFLPGIGARQPLDFLITTAMLFIVNGMSLLLPVQKNESLLNMLHMLLHMVFTWIVLMPMTGRMDVMSLALFLTVSLVFLNMLYLQHGENTVVFSICMGCYCLFFGVLASAGITGIYVELRGAYRLLLMAMYCAAAGIFFVLWRKDKRKWIQYYFLTGAFLLMSWITPEVWEKTAFILVIFCVTRLLSGRKELAVPDCILTAAAVWQGISAMLTCDRSFFWLFAGCMLLMIFFVKQAILFHEIALTLFLLAGGLIYGESNWTLPALTGMLLVLFILFNHVPLFQKQKQQPYNIFNIVLAALLYFSAWFCYDYRVSSAAMALGSLAVILMFRERYGLRVKRKYLILAGFLIFMVLTAHYPSQVIVSSILMLIALLCACIGFYTGDRGYRLSGLILAIAVCMKLVFYDFRALDALPKAFLFLGVGIMALGISFLYLYSRRQRAR